MKEGFPLASISSDCRRLNDECERSIRAASPSISATSQYRSMTPPVGRWSDASVTSSSSGRGGRGGRGAGVPRVPPGNYTVVITAGGNTATGTIGVQR